MNRYLFLIVLLISILNVSNTSDEEDFSEAMKRFLSKKKTTTTTQKPGSNAISALFTTTSSSIHGDKYGKTRSTALPIKLACDSNNPCQNGGTCKSLSSGRHYCQCTEQYYGRNCEKKFKSTGYKNKYKPTTDPCSSSPCRNSGKCIPSRKTYSCQCKPPYYGINCDKRLSKREEIPGESSSSNEEYFHQTYHF